MTRSDAFEDFPTASTLLVTVESDEAFHERGLETIDRLERGEEIEHADVLSFPSVEALFGTLTPRTMELLETIADAGPASIRETARVVDRDVKNVHEELSDLERVGLIQFESDGCSKRPVFPYEEMVISLPFSRDDPETASIPS